MSTAAIRSQEPTRGCSNNCNGSGGQNSTLASGSLESPYRSGERMVSRSASARATRGARLESTIRVLRRPRGRQRDRRRTSISLANCADSLGETNGRTRRRTVGGVVEGARKRSPNVRPFSGLFVHGALPGTRIQRWEVH
jgi:hypothetical protein